MSRRHSQMSPKVGAWGLEVPPGLKGKSGTLGASERPIFFSHFVRIRKLLHPDQASVAMARRWLAKDRCARPQCSECSDATPWLLPSSDGCREPRSHLIPLRMKQTWMCLGQSVEKNVRHCLLFSKSSLSSLFNKPLLYMQFHDESFLVV